MTMLNMVRLGFRVRVRFLGYPTFILNCASLDSTILHTDDNGRNYSEIKYYYLMMQLACTI